MTEITPPFPAPLADHRETVRPDWIDYNGHMNVAYYVLVFDHATDVLFGALGLGSDYLERTNCSVFVVESHIRYLREVTEGDPLRTETRLLGFDDKRLHFHHTMRQAEDDFVAATTELMALHVDLTERRALPFPPPVMATLRRAWASHGALPPPDDAGRAIRPLTGMDGRTS